MPCAFSKSPTMLPTAERSSSWSLRKGWHVHFTLKDSTRGAVGGARVRKLVPERRSHSLPSGVTMPFTQKVLSKKLLNKLEI